MTPGLGDQAFPSSVGRMACATSAGRSSWELRRGGFQPGRVERAGRAGPLRAVLDGILAMPTVDADWRQVDLSVPSSPVIVVQLRVGDRELRFLTMVTAFQAPQTVMLDELRIETWFPCDGETAAACRELAGEGAG